LDRVFVPEEVLSLATLFERLANPIENGGDDGPFVAESL
jgi:hypothetical protein